MSKTKWHSGPPPSVGWWPASRFRDDAWMRWWDGERWSFAAHLSFSAKQAEDKASMSADFTGINWTDRPASWPERSRT
jgi:hypothetical protein